MINMNVIYIYILILATRIYDVNHFLGICIGCQYAFTIFDCNLLIVYFPTLLAIIVTVNK